MKYSITPANRPSRNSFDIINQLCAMFQDTNSTANQHMSRIEELEAKGERYSYESFDVLSSAWAYAGWF